MLCHLSTKSLILNLQNYTMDNLRIIRKSQEEMKQKMVMEEQSTPVSRKRKASTNLDMPVKKYITRRTFRPRRNTGRKPKSIFEDGKCWIQSIIFTISVINDKLQKRKIDL